MNPMSFCTEALPFTSIHVTCQDILDSEVQELQYTTDAGRFREILHIFCDHFYIELCVLLWLN